MAATLDCTDFFVAFVLSKAHLILFLGAKRPLQITFPSLCPFKTGSIDKKGETKREGNDNKRAWSRGINGVLCGHVSIYVKKKIFLL